MPGEVWPCFSSSVRRTRAQVSSEQPRIRFLVLCWDQERPQALQPKPVRIGSNFILQLRELTHGKYLVQCFWHSRHSTFISIIIVILSKDRGKKVFYICKFLNVQGVDGNRDTLALKACAERSHSTRATLLLSFVPNCVRLSSRARMCLAASSQIKGAVNTIVLPMWTERLSVDLAKLKELS